MHTPTRSLTLMPTLTPTPTPCLQLNVVLEFVDGMKSQLIDIDAKLDALGDAVGAMHKDVKRLAGRPVLDVYDDWTALATKSRLQDEVYIEAMVCGPGPKKNFLPDEKENKPLSVTEAFFDFMGGQANILLLSGPAGSGKSTAYIRLQTWVLSEYTRMKKKEEVSSAGGLVE